METTTLEKSIDSISEEATVDQIAEVWMNLGTAKRIIREVEKRAKMQIMEWIKAHGGRLEIPIGGGDSLAFWIGPDKKIKIKNVVEAVNFLLSVASPEQFVGVMSTGAVKHGDLRKLLDELGMPEKFDDLFETIIGEKLEDNAPSVKREAKDITSQLKIVDTRFIDQEQDMKIIQVDNFDREYISDILIAENIHDEAKADIMCKALNDKYSDDRSSVFFKVVTDDHKLFKFEP